MKYDYLRSAIETTEVNELNEKLKSGWQLLDIAGGRQENGEPYFLYSLGKFDENVMLMDSL